MALGRSSSVKTRLICHPFKCKVTYTLARRGTIVRGLYRRWSLSYWKGDSGIRNSVQALKMRIFLLGSLNPCLALKSLIKAESSLHTTAALLLHMLLIRVCEHEISDCLLIEG